jgi:hypothetical protein
MCSFARCEAQADGRFARLLRQPAGRIRRIRLRSLAAALIAGLSLAVLVTGCGGADPHHDDVMLLPQPAASSHVWHWTAQCPFGPSAGNGCGRAGPVLGFAQLDGDEWNLGGDRSTGSLGMSLSSRGAVTMDGRFAQAQPCTERTCLAPSAYTWVRGYPSILYGINQCHAGTSPPVSRVLPLPMRLAAIPAHLIGVTAYAAQTAQVTYDVAYDLWLHDTGTKQPCRSEGTLEIMVWTGYDERALLPASMQIGTASIPFAVGRVVHPGAQAWSVYASNIAAGGRTAPWGGTLWFVLRQSDVVRRGLLRVDLSAVLGAASRILQDNYQWRHVRGRYWLDTVSFGAEFGPANGDPMDSGPARFSMRISAYCLDARSTLHHAACP